MALVLNDFMKELYCSINWITYLSSFPLFLSQIRTSPLVETVANLSCRSPCIWQISLGVLRTSRSWSLFPLNSTTKMFPFSPRAIFLFIINNIYLIKPQFSPVLDVWALCWCQLLYLFSLHVHNEHFPLLTVLSQYNPIIKCYKTITVHKSCFCYPKQIHMLCRFYEFLIIECCCICLEWVILYWRAIQHPNAKLAITNSHNSI